MAANPKEYCHIARDACLNPAGFRLGDGASCTNSMGKRTRWQCPRCGQTTCAACRAPIERAGKKIPTWCAECIGEEKRLERGE